ncbi:hypothetical protein RUE5091_00865 [Ruegeria denitrificans]|uniref:Uncharacterized protein n=1 Tax=Ruegeria denitrificans TaxID=1715692 RepID=A0A0N7M8P0_9RHOB|nr:hypothetical protein [Ruegeria denitrificans]CUJ89392.1 hypothetical protein RUE5091_00865 [Ruegeria denitrificans]
MAHTASAPRGVVVRPVLLIIIALTGILGFSLGQNWPPAASTTTEAAIPSEDWHGNVRRSTWSD